MRPFLIPNCDHAVLLLNKAAQVMLQDPAAVKSDLADYMTDRGHELFKARLLLAGTKDYARLVPATVTLRGRSEYLFTVARCGKCALCRSSRRYELCTRADMETASWSSVPYLITLTYDEKHLPKDKGLFLRDLQLFFKRLRIAWSRAGVNHDIRYLACGEYGKKGRPHYHIILWNNPYDADEIRPIEHRLFQSDVFNAWSRCQPQSFDCRPASQAAGAYVTKYLTKQLVYSKAYGSRRAPFIVSSIGHGGLGSRLIDAQASFYRQYPHLQDFQYRSFDGYVIKVPILSYLKNRLFPTPSRQIPVWYKNRLKDIVKCLEILQPAGCFTPRQIDETLRALHLPYLMIPQLSPVKLPDCWLARSMLIRQTAIMYNRLLDEVECVSLNQYYGYECDAHAAAMLPGEDLRGHLAYKILRVTQDVSRCQCKEWLD